MKHARSPMTIIEIVDDDVGENMNADLPIRSISESKFELNAPAGGAAASGGESEDCLIVSTSINQSTTYSSHEPPRKKPRQTLERAMIANVLNPIPQQRLPLAPLPTKYHPSYLSATPTPIRWKPGGEKKRQQQQLRQKQGDTSTIILDEDEEMKQDENIHSQRHLPLLVTTPPTSPHKRKTTKSTRPAPNQSPTSLIDEFHQSTSTVEVPKQPLSGLSVNPSKLPNYSSTTQIPLSAASSTSMPKTTSAQELQSHRLQPPVIPCAPTIPRVPHGSPTARPTMSLSALLATGGDLTEAITSKYQQQIQLQQQILRSDTTPQTTIDSTSINQTLQLPCVPSKPPSANTPSSHHPRSPRPPVSATTSTPTTAPYISSERNREARAALPGVSCKQCEKFYALVGVGKETEEGHTCEHVASRHRYEFPIALTPPTYWDVCSPGSAQTYCSPSKQDDSSPESAVKQVTSKLPAAAVTNGFLLQRASALHAITSLQPHTSHHLPQRKPSVIELDSTPPTSQSHPIEPIQPIAGLLTTPPLNQPLIHPTSTPPQPILRPISPVIESYFPTSEEQALDMELNAHDESQFAAVESQSFESQAF